MSKDIIIPQEVIINKIYSIRGQKVMLDSDLAELYGVETKRLNEQVKRNNSRFPDDFMFQLTIQEWENLKSQIATSSWGGRRKLPYAFTEHGVLMLSSVLNSDRAIAVNIHIMRVYTKLKEMLLIHKDVLVELETIKQKVGSNSNDIELIFNYLKQFELAKQQELDYQNREKIGYKSTKKHN
ncbi:MAG TPA: ORF6N domain-containing protein [Vicingus sp.]|nr:MAG: ORF6N domain-containing protein [Flavobacteriales bacterium]HRN41733.1 ORF6N domain-containing protein [Vicingus sp.]HRP59571.1 ORF6N domain-containing protein [Vicingus sp.]